MNNEVGAFTAGVLLGALVMVIFFRVILGPTAEFRCRQAGYALEVETLVYQDTCLARLNGNEWVPLDQLDLVKAD